MSTTSQGDELHNVLLNELRRSATATSLEPTLILERDSLGRSHLIKLHHSADEEADADEDASVERGQRMFRVVIEEPVQDNHYELRLDFDKQTFAYVYKRVAFEGGDGFYETTHRGSFSKESTGGVKRHSGFKRAPSKKNLLALAPTSTTAVATSPPPEHSPRRPDPSSYYVCKVEVRDYRSDWEPWDKRQAPEKVSRKGDTFHQELLFKCLNASEVINENVAPVCVMTIVEGRK